MLLYNNITDASMTAITTTTTISGIFVGILNIFHCPYRTKNMAVCCESVESIFCNMTNKRRAEFICSYKSVFTLVCLSKFYVPRDDDWAASCTTPSFIRPSVSYNG